MCSGRLDAEHGLYASEAKDRCNLAKENAYYLTDLGYHITSDGVFPTLVH